MCSGLLPTREEMPLSLAHPTGLLRRAGQDGVGQLPGTWGHAGVARTLTVPAAEGLCGREGRAAALSPQGRGPGSLRTPLCCERPRLPGTLDLLCLAPRLISPTAEGSCK